MTAAQQPLTEQRSGGDIPNQSNIPGQLQKSDTLGHKLHPKDKRAEGALVISPEDDSCFRTALLPRKNTQHGEARPELTGAQASGMSVKQ